MCLALVVVLSTLPVQGGLLILYVVATAIALGGVGDLTISTLFEVHKRFLGMADVPAATTSLILHLLHALGGGLVVVGIASFALVHFAVRRGERWALWTMLAAVVASEGANAVGMYAVGSFWYVSVTYIVLTAIGVTLLVAAKSKAQDDGKSVLSRHGLSNGAGVIVVHCGDPRYQWHFQEFLRNGGSRRAGKIRHHAAIPTNVTFQPFANPRTGITQSSVASAPVMSRCGRETRPVLFWNRC